MPNRREFLGAGAAAVAGAASAPARDRDPFPLPDGVVARFGSPRFRHARDLAVLGFDRENVNLLTTDDSGVQAWEVASGRRIETLTFAPNELAVGRWADDRTVSLLVANARGRLDWWRWDPGTGRSSVQPTGLRADAGVALAPDGESVAETDTDRNEVRLLRRGGRAPVWSATIPAGRLAAPLFSPDGRWVAVTVRRLVLVFDARTGRQVFSFPYSPRITDAGNARPVFPVFGPDGRLLVVPHSALTVWDLVTGRSRDLPASFATEAVFTRGGRAVAVVEDLQRVAEKDLKTGRTLRTLAAQPRRWSTATVSADGALFAQVDSNGGHTLALWDLAADRPLPQSADPPGRFHGLRFGPAGRLVAAVSADEWVGWDVGSGTPRKVALSDRSLRPVALSPDENRIVTLPQADEASGFDLRDTATGRFVRRLEVPRAEESNRGAFSDDGRRFVAAGAESAFAWDLPGGKRTAVPLGGQVWARAVVASRDGRLAAVVRDNPAAAPEVRLPVVVVDFDCRVVASRFTVALAADGFAFAPDGSLFGLIELDLDPESAPPRNTLVVHDTATGTERTRLRFDARHVVSLGWWFAFAPDGRSVATADGDGNAVAVRELATGGVRTTVRHAGRTTGAAFTPDGRRLAVASPEAPVYLWDYRGDRLPRAAPNPGALWADLAGRDAARAFRAVTALTRLPNLALPLLKAKLPPVTPADPVDVRATIAELDAPDFRTRDRATARLRRLADRAVPLLHDAQTEVLSPEARRRLDGLLADRTPTAEQLRALRAVEVLEGIGPGARSVLAAWAAGAEGARLTTEAAAALRRLGSR